MMTKNRPMGQGDYRNLLERGHREHFEGERNALCHCGGDLCVY